MSYSPPSLEIVPPMVSPWTMGWSDFAQERVAASIPVSGSAEGANYVAYFPIRVPVATPVRRLFCAWGSAPTGTYDVGIYTDTGSGPGRKIVSTGNQSVGSSYSLSFVDVTDVVLPPGRYWLAVVFSAATTVIRVTSGFCTAGKFVESVASAVLPDTAIPVTTVNGHLYLFGFATTVSP